MSSSIDNERAEFELQHYKRMATLEMLTAGLELLQRTGYATATDLQQFRSSIKQVCFPAVDLTASREEQMTAALRKLGVTQSGGSADGSLV